MTAATIIKPQALSIQSHLLYALLYDNNIPASSHFGPEISLGIYPCRNKIPFIFHGWAITSRNNVKMLSHTVVSHNMAWPIKICNFQFTLVPKHWSKYLITPVMTIFWFILSTLNNAVLKQNGDIRRK